MGFGAGAAAGLGLGILQGEQQRKIARRNARDQERAQRQAQDRLAGERRLAAQREKRANQKQPEIASLLSRERAQAKTGPGATLLSGTTGVGKDSLLLGRRTLLGS